MSSAGSRTGVKCLADDFFAVIDSERKAYFLGWIASDGTIRKRSIRLSIRRNDVEVLELLRASISPDLPIRDLSDHLVELSIPSPTLVADVSRWLGVAPGRNAGEVGFPNLESDELRWAFLRGYFDGSGRVSSFGSSPRAPRCRIGTGSPRIRRAIAEFCGIQHFATADALEWNGRNALDFLAKLYDDASVYLRRNKRLYRDWACWVPSLSGGGTYGHELLFRWAKTDSRAVAPFKRRASDSGYDLTFIRIVKRIGRIEMYGTGLKIAPEYGWYFDLVPRSSIIRTGYMLANSVGVIDGSYRGEIMVPLAKVSDEAPDLELPARVVQILPRPIVHVRLVEVDRLDETSREASGFGSSGGHPERSG